MSIAIGFLLFLLGGFVGVAIMSLIQIAAASDKNVRQLQKTSEKE